MCLVELYEQKRELLLKIKTITLHMDKALKMGEAEVFLGLIDDRQELIDKIDIIDKGLSVDNTMENVSNAIIDAAKEDILLVIKDIHVLNEKISSMAREYCNEIKNNIKNMGNAKRAMNSYIKKTTQVYGYFIENKK